MKNLTKIFMAVVAGMFAFSCATDTTEDLGVQVGGGEGLTSITLSLEESRVQLGEKAGQKYPLYWTAGDKISVNGVEAEAQIIETNPAYATFTVAEADKYELAYPAAPAGQVLFAEKQNHVAAGNTFESGVSTMYGLGTIEEGFNLYHLTGVLKIGVTGSAVLSKIQISTIDRAPIAGAFDIDFETGEVKATTASKNVIEYSFGEGLQLSTEPQYVHVVVPAGQYDELYVTLYDNAHGVMYATVKAGESKPLTAGNVREFKTAIPYAANTQKFVIDSPEQLAAFKAAVEAEGGLAMDAVLTEDIDMTGVEWTAINGENYTHTVVGNGYAIKGLTAPLFATTSASFKGLHLEGVNITTNNVVKLGALACILTQTTAEGAKVENCSVSGTITVNNPGLDATDISLMYGGLVGNVMGTTIIGCENHANIEATGVVAAGNAKNMYIGGVVGFGNNATIDETIIYTTIQNSKNSGKITIQNTLTTAEGATTGKVTSNLTAAGIFGHSSTNANTNDNGLTIDNCENSGAIDFNGVGATVRLGGIIGYGSSTAAIPTTISNNVNSGAITVKEGASISADLYLAGVVGHSVRGNLSNLVNNGAITIEDGTDLSATNVGGIISQHSSSGGTFNVATNNGAITISTTNSDIVRVGGVMSLAVGATTDIVNNGNITYSGKTSDRAASPVFIGGVVSQLSYYASLKGATNTGNILCNTGGKSTLSINIGGVVCCSACRNIQNLTNGVDGDNTKGKITYQVSGANTVLALIAGVICRATIKSGKDATYTNCNNYGDIYVDNSAASAYSFNNGYIGGLASYVCGVGTWTNCHNYGGITLGENTIVNRAIRAAGLFAAYDSTILASTTITGITDGIEVVEPVEQTVDGCSNGGNITIGGKYAMYNSGAKYSYMGGLVGAIPETAVVTIQNGFVNSGNISVAGEYNYSSGSVRIGGVAGDVLAETLTIDGTIVNTGAISYSSDWDDTGSAHAVYVGGIFGKSVAEITTPTINTGGLAISGDYSTMNVGGVVGNTTKGVTGAQVYCEIEAKGQTSAKIGLIAGVERSESVVASNCQVGGNIVIEEVTEEDPNSGVGQTKVTPGDITSSNWFKHIYSTEVAEEVATEDGCSLIESAPAI